MTGNNHEDSQCVILGTNGALKTFLLGGMIEAMKSPGGRELLFCESPNPGTARGHNPSFVHVEDWPLSMVGEAPRGRHCFYGEERQPHPAKVDANVARHRDKRIARACIKREKKSLKRLGLKYFPMTGPGCEMATTFLKAIGEYESFQGNGQSVDGFSLVSWANTKLDD